MSSTDYYKCLGVSQSAGPEEIKKAYRRMAIKHHPDRNAGDKKSEEKFKEISEAYAVLSDPEKRRQYDAFGHAGFRQQYSQEDIFRNFDMGDMFREFGLGGADSFAHIFGGRGRSKKRRGGRSSFAQPGFENIFSDFGRGGRAMKKKGEDITYDLPVSLTEAVFGAERVVAFNTAEGVSKLSVKVPPSLDMGKKLRLAGKGQPGVNGGPYGDLLVNIIATPHPVFRREGYDLAMDVTIKPSEALLGASVQVQTLDGKTLNLRIPPGTASHGRLRIKGHGVPESGGRPRGDLYVRVLVSTRDVLTERQKELLKALSEEGL
ncbi:MAG: DnaJ C-terminal domain-containing protein [Pseudomonadota bacterium]